MKQSSTDTSPTGNQSNDLHAAMAAVLRKQMKSRGWVTPESMADAVIKELGFRRELLGENTGYPHASVTRYVTEWKSSNAPLPVCECADCQ